MTNLCPEHHRGLHVFRKTHHGSRSRGYISTACVCVPCRMVFAVSDCGMRSAAELSAATTPPHQGSVAPAIHDDPFDQLDGGVGDLIGVASSDLDDDRARHILRARCGLDGEYVTLSSLAEEWSISRERVRQIQEQACKRVVRHARIAPHSAAGRLAAMLGPGNSVLQIVGALAPHLAGIAEPIQRVQGSVILRAAGFSPDTIAPITDVLAAVHRAEDAFQPIGRRELSAVSTHRRVTSWLDDAGAGDPATADPAPWHSARLVDPGERSGSLHLSRLGIDVQFESTSERQFLRMLDRTADLVANVVAQPVPIPYLFGGRRRVYFPDFLVELIDHRLVLVEVKGPLQVADAINLAKYQAGREFAARRGWGWRVVVPNHDGDAVDALRNRELNPVVVQLITERIATRGTLSARDVIDIRAQHPDLVQRGGAAQRSRCAERARASRLVDAASVSTTRGRPHSAGRRHPLIRIRAPVVGIVTMRRATSDRAPARSASFHSGFDGFSPLMISHVGHPLCVCSVGVSSRSGSSTGETVT